MAHYILTYHWRLIVYLCSNIFKGVTCAKVGVPYNVNFQSFIYRTLEKNRMEYGFTCQWLYYWFDCYLWCWRGVWCKNLSICNWPLNKDGFSRKIVRKDNQCMWQNQLHSLHINTICRTTICPTYFFHLPVKSLCWTGVSWMTMEHQLCFLGEHPSKNCQIWAQYDFLIVHHTTCFSKNYENLFSIFIIT